MLDHGWGADSCISKFLLTGKDNNYALSYIIITNAFWPKVRSYASWNILNTQHAADRN